MPRPPPRLVLPFGIVPPTRPIWPLSMDTLLPHLLPTRKTRRNHCRFYPCPMPNCAKCLFGKSTKNNNESPNVVGIPLWDTNHPIASFLNSRHGNNNNNNNNNNPRNDQKNGNDTIMMKTTTTTTTTWHAFGGNRSRTNCRNKSDKNWLPKSGFMSRKTLH